MVRLGEGLVCEITERLVKDWERLCLIMLQDNFKHASIQLCFKITSISRSFRVLTKALFIFVWSLSLSLKFEEDPISGR